MNQPKPLHIGDRVQLRDPAYGMPTGGCTVIADQGTSNVVWFVPTHGGACHVARRGALKVIRRTARPTDRKPTPCRSH